MQTLAHSTQGLGFLIKLNADRVMFPLAIAAALISASYISWLNVPAGF